MTASDTLEDRLREKLSSGEISQKEYDDLHDKFSKLGLLQSDQKGKTSTSSVSSSGSTDLSGGKINGKVSIQGRTKIKKSLECQSLSISGSSVIDGDLTVLDKSSVSGELVVNGQAKFGSKIALSGRLEVKEDFYGFNTASLAGRSKIGGSLQMDGKVLISGKFEASSLKVTGLTRIEGKISILNDVMTSRFECQSGLIEIGGDLKGEEILIFNKFRENSAIHADFPTDNTDSISGLISNVVNVVFPTLINTVSGIFDSNPSKITISGDIEGDYIDISNCHVSGDVTGREVIVGPSVNIGGQIKYREKIEVPANSNYKIVKID